MANLKIFFILAVIIFNSHCEAATGLAASKQIGQTLKDIVSTISKVVSTYRKHHPPVTIQTNTSYPQSANRPPTTLTELPGQKIQVERTVRRMMNNVRKITNKMPKYTESITDTLDSMLEMVVEKLQIEDNPLRMLNDSLEKIHQHSTTIDRFYGDFIKFSQPKLKVAPSTINELVMSIFSYRENKLIVSVGQLRQYFEPREGAFMYEALAKYFTSPRKLPFETMCDSTLSLQEEIKMIYNLVMVQELRAFMMTIFSHKYEELIQPAPTSNSGVALLLTQALETMNSYLIAIKKITGAASRERLNCDPVKHNLDIDCFRLDYLFGLYYLNERQVTTACTHPVDVATSEEIEIEIPPMRRKFTPARESFAASPSFVKSFSSSSKEYNFLRNRRAIESTTIIRNKVQCLDMSYYQESLLVPKYCPSENVKCNGILHHCKNVPSASFCEANMGYGRRYQWINNGTNDISSLNCAGNFVDTMQAASCKSFLCQCSEEGAQSSATRAVNLMPQISDIEHNMVVTNVRFQKKDNVVHLQIEQGYLLPEGKINNSTTSWVPLPDLVYYQNVPEGSFWLKKGARNSPLIYDTDYTFLKHDRMTLNLDDVISPPEFIVTGVRLNYKSDVQDSKVTPLELQLHVTPYDYYLGHLKPTTNEPSRWIDIKTSGEHSEAYQRIRRNVDLSGVDDPLKSLKNDIISGPNLFVNFQITDYKKDFGQLTVPYFDSRAAGVASLSAISGVGIVHRGGRGFGGFLALKLINVNHARFIDFDLTQRQIDYFTSF